MTTYKIDNDGFDYQELDLEIDDFIDNFPDHIDDIEIHDFSKNNMALKPYWKPVRTGFSKIEGERNLLPDISRWIGATLVLSPKAHRLLGDAMAPMGEFLPVDIDGDIYQIFHCLEIKNGKKESALVFKTSKDHCLSVHCDERFKGLVSSFELTGITFLKD